MLEILHILADTYHYNFTPISKQIHIEMILHKILSCKFVKSPEDILTHLEQIKDQMQKTPTKETPSQSISDYAEKNQEPSKQITQQNPTNSPAENTPLSEKDSEKKNITLDTPSSTILKESNDDKKEKIRKENILQFASVEMKGKIIKNI